MKEKNPEVFVVLLEGLSGSGKTTLANAVLEELNSRGIKTQLVDGDETRKGLGEIFGTSKEERSKMGNVNRLIGNYLIMNDINVIYALVCPFESIREAFRNFFKDRVKFYEIYLDASVDVCVKRDVKGLYQKQKEGKISNLNGIDDIYERPLRADLVVHTGNESIECSKEKVIEFLEKHRVI